MKPTLMNLKILLPHGVFAEIENVKKIVVETTAGSYGILPRRLDCTAALETGILLYEPENDGEKKIPGKEGSLIKKGIEESISVANAKGNAQLDELKAWVEKEMQK